jgi:hypothetical protein
MRGRLRTLLIVAITLGLLALFLRQANLADVWREIGRARWSFLVGALGLTAFTYVLRAWRWQVLLAPIGRVHFGPALRATVIGFAVNSLLPARAGEVLRPYLLARREGLRASSAFATIILERLLDLIAVLLLFGVFVLLYDATSFGSDPSLMRAVQAGGLAAGVSSVAGLAVLFVLAGHPERLGALAGEARRVLPARAAAFVVHLTTRFAEGLAILRRPALLGGAALLSLPLWLSIAGTHWLVARAFHIAMPFTGSFLLVALLTVGVAVPTPGAVGGFHYAFRLGTTVFFGASNERAVGAALLAHAIAFVPVAIVGLVLMLQDGLSLARLRGLSDGAGLEGDPAPAASVSGEAGGPAA